MTIDVNEFRAVLRALADEAAARGKAAAKNGNTEGAQFETGRQAGLVTALARLTAAEDEAARERDANVLDEQIGEEAARLELIGHREVAIGGGNPHTLDGYGRGVNLDAVRRLEEFAREAGGAVDMASGTVYSDADEGL